MGRPRMIIVIRHAQSEGNQNRQIHQTIPDHRVKLTPEGWTQAHEAGRHLRAMLKPDDTLQIYTSPYRRTRETTEGILRTLTSDEPEPSPFKRQGIKVWEEPRLREQDFGNFQPDSAAMERMWKERADYGHFFFRIPNGESAADAYDRVSGFNESLWRSFSEKDFPSVCVLVTHGLMTRVFLMKWYHWSVEYFEDLRNVNHCEFVVMTRPEAGGKYILKNELRTWSELRQRAAADGKPQARDRALSIPTRKRPGDCPDDCGHVHDEFMAKKPKRQTSTTTDAANKPIPDEPQTSQGETSPAETTSTSNSLRPPPQSNPEPNTPTCTEEDSEAFPSLPATQTLTQSAVAFSKRLALAAAQLPRTIPYYMEAGRDFGGSFSGAATPAIPGSPSHSRGPSADYGFPSAVAARVGGRRSVEEVVNGKAWGDGEGENGRAWEEAGEDEARADALGDQSEEVRADALGDQSEEVREDDIGGAVEIGRAKAGEAVAEGKEEAGRTVEAKGG